MTIEKLSSGSYRATIMQDGVRYRKTFKHKPTQKEVLQALAEQMEEKPGKIDFSFKYASEQYIDMKSKVLSPKTEREYKGLSRNIPEWFSELFVDDITQVEVNKLVNELSAVKSPKTVYNYHGFVSAVLSTFKPSLVLNTKLPQKIKNEPYIPSSEDIKKIMEELKGSQFEIPIYLACYGLRREEICALDISDVEGTVVHVTKGLVQDKNNNWVIKTTKTYESTRDVIISQELADLIQEQGYVYKGFPHSISKAMKRVQGKLGIPHFTMHKLRHYFASVMSEMDVPDADIMALGGWKTDHVMKTVYRHSMLDKDKDRKQEIIDKFSKNLF